MLVKDKNILVMGVINKRSIAWAIAQALHAAGANLMFTYQGERMEESVRELVNDAMPGSLLLRCDVTNDAEIDAVFQHLEEKVGVLHGIVHSIAFAKAEDLNGMFVETSRDGYLLAQNISAYSLVAVANRARKIMTEGGSIMTMTYLGGERVVENYNVMGVAKAALDMSMRYLANELGPQNIRVNAVSAGPIRTLAAKGVKDFNKILHTIEEKAPLRRTTDASEVADTALYLMSNLSRGVTGEVIHVDSGYHILGF
ncbi:enoyl-ACP reductase FabI [Sulfoacidibacillus thermotolerans]|uniref:Enoyl-[acyl-carrier-protein] reductase [NADH] n=1 Tax=Sulfoacidibacillus thermotolerans TaxID=1765684 RepID=A0A2U3DAK8_SULT2|nr:enoyl-ACP reductase FabI [Sulfoacidibacillus thermotolerans]PWI58328.1 enoyl-ACP reductase [Sulfoacidibacillus thermotolerans]